MKIKLLIMMLVILSASQSIAQENKLRDDFYYHVAASPVYIWSTILLHESSHVIVSEATGLHVVKFRPYPGWDSNTREWYLGRTYFEGYPSSKNQANMILAAPYINQMILFSSADVSLSYINKEKLPAGIMYFGMFWSWVDFTYNANIYSNGNDFSKLEETGFWNRPTRIITSNTLALIGAWRLYVRGKDVLFNKDNDSLNLVIMPYNLGISGVGTF
jgi:hypothetical protein